MASINCKCGSSMRCIDSRPRDVFGMPGTKRRYECLECKSRVWAFTFVISDSEESCKNPEDKVVEKLVNERLARQLKALPTEHLFAEIMSRCKHPEGGK